MLRRRSQVRVLLAASAAVAQLAERLTSPSTLGSRAITTAAMRSSGVTSWVSKTSPRPCSRSSFLRADAKTAGYFAKRRLLSSLFSARTSSREAT